MYNKHEHDFTGRTDKELQERLDQLRENNRLIGYSEARRERIESEMTYLSFEIFERLKREYNEELDDKLDEFSDDF